MKALVDSGGDVVVIAESLDGYDQTGMTVVENVPQPVHEYIWDRQTRSFKARPPTATEQAESDLRADQNWERLAALTPAQIDSWLTNNVTSIASARAVLKFLMLAIRALQKRDVL